MRMEERFGWSCSTPGGLMGIRRKRAVWKAVGPVGEKGHGAEAASHPVVLEYDDIVKEHIGKYVEQSNKIGGDVAKQARA